MLRSIDDKWENEEMTKAAMAMKCPWCIGTAFTCLSLSLSLSYIHNADFSACGTLSRSPDHEIASHPTLDTSSLHASPCTHPRRTQSQI